MIKDVELDGRGGKGCKDLSISALSCWLNPRSYVPTLAVGGTYPRPGGGESEEDRRASPDGAH